MYGTCTEASTGRLLATPALGAALPAMSLRRDESIEGTSAVFGNHQWKPNAVAEPPV